MLQEDEYAETTDLVTNAVIAAIRSASPTCCMIDYWTGPLSRYVSVIWQTDWRRVHRETGRRATAVSDETFIRLDAACDARTERDAEMLYYRHNPQDNCPCGCEGDIECHSHWASP